MSRLEIQVQKAIYGDIKAYTKIIERTQHMACGYAFSILGDFHYAEDASQEAFIEAYQRLPQLKEPKAFLSWFRQIIFKQCDRHLRKRKLLARTLEESSLTDEEISDPAVQMEAKELRQQVAKVMLQLPQKQREVTSLFYVNGYSYSDISSFLDVPVTTVKKRLYDSRNILRKRMIDMVDNGMKNNMPDKHFAGGVITELLNRPKLLEIESHPLHDAVRTICSELPEYEYIEGSEVIKEDELMGIGSDVKSMYKTKDGKYLRNETSVTTFQAIAGRTPPVCLITAGRVFRPDEEDELHLKVFHQLDVICVKSGASIEEMKAELECVVRSVIGLLPLRWVEVNFGCVFDGTELEVNNKGKWLSVAGAGMLSQKMLEDYGFDPGKVSGFAFGLGLERLVAIKIGVKDIRQLWQYPYV